MARSPERSVLAPFVVMPGAPSRKHCLFGEAHSDILVAASREVSRSHGTEQLFCPRKSYKESGKQVGEDIAFFFVCACVSRVLPVVSEGLRPRSSPFSETISRRALSGGEQKDEKCPETDGRSTPRKREHQHRSSGHVLSHFDGNGVMVFFHVFPYL